MKEDAQPASCSLPTSGQSRVSKLTNRSALTLASENDSSQASHRPEQYGYWLSESTHGRCGLVIKNNVDHGMAESAVAPQPRVRLFINYARILHVEPGITNARGLHASACIHPKSQREAAYRKAESRSESESELELWLVSEMFRSCCVLRVGFHVASSRLCGSHRLGRNRGDANYDKARSAQQPAKNRVENGQGWDRDEAQRQFVIVFWCDYS